MPETNTCLAANSEPELLLAVRRRDRGAFAELYRRYHPRLHGYLRRLLKQPFVVEEVLDDVMLVVWTDAQRFRGQSPISSWIFGIAYRRAMTALRQESRHAARIDHAVDAEQIPARSAGDHDHLAVALGELSPEHRQVVELTYFCGFSYKEIARIADCPVNTVKTRMYHARRRLKYLLPALAGDGKEHDREQA